MVAISTIMMIADRMPLLIVVLFTFNDNCFHADIPRLLVNRQEYVPSSSSLAYSIVRMERLPNVTESFNSTPA